MTGGTDPLVELSIEEPAWEAAIERIDALAESAAEAALIAAGLPPALCSISVLLCSDEAIAALNMRFRAREGATNVLSWPAFPLKKPLAGEADLLRSAGQGAPGRGERLLLGDIALAFGVVENEAKIAVKSLEAHVAHLIVHGVLHLLGYDHGEEDEAEAMAQREIAALSAIGVADPYVEGGGEAVSTRGAAR